MKAKEISWVTLALCALGLPAGAWAAAVDLRGDACGGTVARGEPFTVGGIARSLEGGELVGLRVVFDVRELGEVEPLGPEDFRPTAFVPDLVEGPVRLDNWASFAAVAVEGLFVTATAELFTLTVTPAATAEGSIRVALAQDYRSYAAFADEAEEDLTPGIACDVYVDGEPPPPPPEPEPPVAAAGGDVDVREGGTVALDGGGSWDRTPPEDLAYRWELIEGAGSLSGADADVATYHAPEDIFEDVVARVRLVVTDPVTGLAGEDEAAVAVTAVIDPPVAVAGPDREVEAGGAVVLDGRASRDREGEDNLQFSWRIAEGRGEIEDFGEPIATYRAPPRVDEELRTVVEMTAFDPDTRRGTFDPLVITVKPRPTEPPIAKAGADRVVVEGARAPLDGSESVDAAGTANLAFAWRIVQGPGEIVDADGPRATYVAPEDVFEAARARLELEVTDPDSGLASVGTMAVTIVDAVPPGCYDFDADGFYIEVDEAELTVARFGRCGFVDCDDTNPLVRPLTIELPRDGIDQNCNGSQTCGTMASGPGAGPLSGAVAAGLALLSVRRRLRRAP